MEENTISGIIVEAVLRVHRELGPGLYENIYEAALFLELTEGYKSKSPFPHFIVRLTWE